MFESTEATKSNFCDRYCFDYNTSGKQFLYKIWNKYMPVFSQIWRNRTAARTAQKAQPTGSWNFDQIMALALVCLARPDYATVPKFQNWKGQKGRYCQSNLNIVFVQLFWPKWSACTLFVINISAQDLFLIGHIKYKDFKGQNVIKAAKNWKIWMRTIK